MLFPYTFTLLTMVCCSCFVDSSTHAKEITPRARHLDSSPKLDVSLNLAELWLTYTNTGTVYSMISKVISLSEILKHFKAS